MSDSKLPNLVEVMADGDDCAFDQPCVFGHRVDRHGVYCHNQAAGMPTKCHRTWYTGGKVRDEDCEGYLPNPEYPRDPQPARIGKTEA